MKNLATSFKSCRLSHAERLLRRHQFRRHQRARRQPTSLPYPPSPDKGLAQHSSSLHRRVDYRKADQTMFVVRRKVVWTYSIRSRTRTARAGACDATMLSTATLFCREGSARAKSRRTKKKILLENMDAPKGTKFIPFNHRPDHVARDDKRQSGGAAAHAQSDDAKTEKRNIPSPS